MASKGRTEGEQLEFLVSRVESFIDHQKRKELSKFWPVLETAWFEAFPETVAIYGSDAQPLNDMPEEQQKEVGEAVKERKTVCPIQP